MCGGTWHRKMTSYGSHVCLSLPVDLALGLKDISSVSIGDVFFDDAVQDFKREVGFPVDFSSMFLGETLILCIFRWFQVS